VIASVLGAGWPGLANGQSGRGPDKAAAEALFEEGRQLAQDGATAAACAKFEQSESLEPAAGTLLNLADCYEKLGRTASAWGALRDATARAELAGEARRAEAARAKAASLEVRLPRLRLVLDDAPAGLKVQQDQRVVVDALWGTPLPVDPGRHEVSAGAPGFVSWSQAVEVPSGPTLIEVHIPRLVPATVPAPPLADERLSRGTAPSSLGSQRTLGLAIGAAGAGGLIAAAIAGVGAIVLKDRNERDTALGWAEAFDWIAVPSAVALGAGAVVYFAAPASRPPQRVVVLAPVFGAHGASLVARRAF
jgi:serine/threonine-protein kinase